jgi:hypothetical protein
MEQMNDLELSTRYPGADLAAIDEKYSKLSAELRSLEEKQRVVEQEALVLSREHTWHIKELVMINEELCSYKHNFNHFINEHYLPLQKAIFYQVPGCHCDHYFGLNPVPGGSGSVGAMGRGVIVGRLWSPCTSDKHRSSTDSDTKTDSQPSLECRSDSEDKVVEEFKDVVEWATSPMVVKETSGEESDTESSDGSFGETWEFLGGPGAGESHL